MDQSLIENVFNDIISGRGVKRYVHDLLFQGIDYSEKFIKQLKKLNYLPTELKSTKIEVGYRIPGFLIKDSKAYFGHLFWEVFSEKRKRKIWGSVMRNNKGDWKIILSGNSTKVVYLNKTKIQAVDIYYLT